MNITGRCNVQIQTPYTCTTSFAIWMKPMLPVARVYVCTAKFVATSEITSLATQVPSSFPLFAVPTASNGKLGRRLGAWLFMQHSMCVNQNPAWWWSQLQEAISEQIFAVGACLPYVTTTCTKLRAICDFYHTESMCNNYWNWVC